MAVTASNIITRCRTLRTNWATRSGKFKDWYDILTLKDELEQEGMESVTSNDPRTGYNLAKHLLTSSIIAHKIETEELEAEQMLATSYLESYVSKRWANQEKRYRQMGRRGWLDEMVAFLLALGWYSIFAMVTQDKVIAEVWHPADCFPNFGPDGLVEHAHIYTISAAAANIKVKQMGWQVRQPFRGNTTIYDHWAFDNDGDVANAIVLGTEFVKEPLKDDALSKLGRLPIFTSPVGGLPDRGSIQQANEWQKHCGEAIVATNEDLGKNYNRMLTFSQQMVRDVANPRWFEQSSGDTPILREEDLFKRGAIFRGALGERVDPLAVPPIPIELRTSLFDYQNMLQRGLFPWAVFGNIQQQMSYLAMANIASASLQVLTPYMEAISGALSDIDNFWVEMIRRNNFRPHGYKPPEHMPEQVEFEVDANIEIPGFMVQKATVSRMIDPAFRLPTTYVIDRLWPEIKDPLRAQAQVRKEDAMMHPDAITVDMIIAYREQARLLRDAGDADAAALYEKLATSLEARIGVPTPPKPTKEVSPGEQAVMREVFPTREGTAPQEGLGRI